MIKYIFISLLFIFSTECLAANTVVYDTATQVITNKTIDGDDNTLQDVKPSQLKSVDSPADEECYTYEATGGTGEWQTCGGAGAGDVTAASNITDNSVVRGDGGAKGIQQSGVIIDDSNNVAIPDNSSITLVGGVIGAGTNRSINFNNPDSLNNFAFIAAYPYEGTNVGTSIQAIPKGTGFNATIKAQFSVFNTDYVADNVNYESLVLRSAGAKYSINATSGGTGSARPIEFQMQNAAKVTIDSTGWVGIGTTSPIAMLDLAGGIKLHKVTSDPCGSGYPEGTMFYNDTSNYMCFCGPSNVDYQVHAPTTACF